MIVIGDSHVDAYKDFCDVVHIDKPTAYNIYKHDIKIRKSLKTLKTNLFIFGEIDCRIHIFYQCKKTGISGITLIENTINKYLDYVSTINRYYHIAVLNIPPAGTQENYYNYTFYAPYETRKFYCKYFNEFLEKQCKLSNILYYSNYYEIIDENFDRKSEFIEDDVHVNFKAAKIIIDKIGV